MPTDHATSIRDPVARRMMLIKAIPREANFNKDSFSFNNIYPPNAVKSGQTIYAKAADCKLTLFTAYMNVYQFRTRKIVAVIILNKTALRSLAFASFKY